MLESGERAYNRPVVACSRHLLSSWTKLAGEAVPRDRFILIGHARVELAAEPVGAAMAKVVLCLLGGTITSLCWLHRPLWPRHQDQLHLFVYTFAWPQSVPYGARGYQSVCKAVPEKAVTRLRATKPFHLLHHPESGNTANSGKRAGKNKRTASYIRTHQSTIGTLECLCVYVGNHLLSPIRYSHSDCQSVPVNRATPNQLEPTYCSNYYFR